MNINTEYYRNTRKRNAQFFYVHTPIRVLISFRPGEGESPPVLMDFGAEALNRINEVEQSLGPVAQS